MASVGLLYVGAVLFVNAMMLLGKVEEKAAAILNLFVGALQVVTPTVIIMTAGGDLPTIMGASGIYLFGFTYLYVGIGLLAGLSSTGVGWFSLFVAISALVYAAHNAFVVGDYPFAVIWVLWSFLWLLFFLVLGLGRAELTRYTGWVTLVEAWLTAVIPAFLLLTGRYTPSATLALILAGVCVAAFGGLWMYARLPKEREPSHA